MQIVIFSDAHNNEVNLGKVLDFCVREKITTVICCGDLASRETLDLMQAELHHLKAVERPAASKAIAEAREKGDLKENLALKGPKNGFKIIK